MAKAFSMAAQAVNFRLNVMREILTRHKTEVFLWNKLSFPDT